MSATPSPEPEFDATLAPVASGAAGAGDAGRGARSFAAWLVRLRLPLLLLGLALYGIATWLGPLPFDRSIENMYPPDDPLRLGYRRLADRFGGHEVALATYDDPGLLAADGAGLARQAGLVARIRQVAGVRDVLALSEIDRTLAALPGARASREERPLLADTPLARRFLELFEGYTHGADHRTAAMAILLATETAERPRDATLVAIRKILESPGVGLSPGLLTGEPVMVSEGFRHVAADGVRLERLSLVLLGATIIACFRSLRWTLLPLLVVQLSLALTRLVLGLTRQRLSLVSSMLAAMVTVVAVAAVVHVIERVRAAQQAGATPLVALRTALAELAAPIVWASITDALGFAALLASSVGPIRSYGLMMTAGALLVLPAIALVLPGGALLGSWDLRPRSAWGERTLDEGLRLTVGAGRRHPALLATLALLVGAVLAAGVVRLEVETDFTRNFRADDPLVAGYELVEQRLGGAGVWDVMVPAPHVLHRAYLERVLDLENRLRSLQQDGRPALTKVLSLADTIDAGEASPLLRWMPIELRTRTMQLTLPAFFGTLRAEEQGQTWLRIMLRSAERQPAAAKAETIRRVRETVRECFPGSGAEPAGEVTGLMVLLTGLIESTLRDQWLCFGLAVAGIGVAMMIALRSIPLALAALVTNIVPVTVVLGTLGWLGRPINLGVAMIAAVSVGLSVDSSLHYLIDYRRRRARGVEVGEALQQVQRQVGRAVVFSTLALTLGFLSLAGSDFIPTATFGLLTSLAMIGGMIGNLAVLPLFVRLVERTTGPLKPRHQPAAR